jgi:hypothetical protein
MPNKKLKHDMSDLWFCAAIQFLCFLQSSFLPPFIPSKKMLRGNDYSNDMYVFTSSFFTTLMVLLPIVVMVLRTTIHDGLREMNISKKYSVHTARYTMIPMNGDEESGCCAAIDY